MTTTTTTPASMSENTACDEIKNLIQTYNDDLKVYSKQQANYNKFDSDYKDWQKKTGKYEKYKYYGVSQDFNVEWGWGHWGSDNTCKECASGNYGWGKDKPIINGEGYCSPPDDTVKTGPLVGGDGYVDKSKKEGNDKYWGWNVWLSRKWWTCTKSDNKKENEKTEYENAKPKPTDYYDGITKFPFNYDTPPTRPVLAPINATCCSLSFSNISIMNGDFNVKDVTQKCSQTVNTTNVTVAPTTAATAAATTGATAATTAATTTTTAPTTTTTTTTTAAPTPTFEWLVWLIICIFLAVYLIIISSVVLIT